MTADEATRAIAADRAEMIAEHLAAAQQLAHEIRDVLPDDLKGAADGNGRLGRMLIPLTMWQWGLIRLPRFYVSAFFESRRDEHYEALLAVSRDDDWRGWVVFFLTAVRAQAEDHLGKARRILELYERLMREVPDLTRSQYAVRALDWMFESPIFRSTLFVHAADIPGSTARRFLGILREAGVLRDVVPASGRRAASMAFPALIEIVDEGSLA